MLRLSKPQRHAVAPVYYPLDLGAVLAGLFGAGLPPDPGLYLGSGEQALAIAATGLLQLYGAEGKRELVVPDFICPSVPRAMRAAGLEPLACPLDTHTWCYRPEALEGLLGPRTLGVVLVHYFGLPPDVEAVRPLLAGRPIIEDRAQGYGCGQSGLAGQAPAVFRVYSFGPGKSLPLNHGGLVVAATADARAWLEGQAAEVAPAGMADGVLNVLFAALQACLLHPRVWPRLPLTIVAGHARAPASARRQLGAAAVRYLRRAERRLPDVIATRRRNALALADALAASPGIRTPAAEVLAAGVCLRLPVMVNDPRHADWLRAELQRRDLIKGANAWGDYVSGSDTAAITAASLVTLPTFPGSETVHPGIVELFRAPWTQE